MAATPSSGEVPKCRSHRLFCANIPMRNSILFKPIANQERFSHNKNASCFLTTPNIPFHSI